jgi:hypothetical protein
LLRLLRKDAAPRHHGILATVRARQLGLGVARHQLKALAVVYGIEPTIILKNIGGATDRETEAVVRWMMDALVDAALRDGT